MTTPSLGHMLPPRTIGLPVLSGTLESKSAYGSLVSAVEDFVREQETPLGPFVFDSTYEGTIYEHVAREGFGAVAPDLDIGAEIPAFIFSYDEPTKIFTVVSSTSSGFSFNVVSANSLIDRIMRFISSRIDSPVHWIFIAPNDASIVDHVPRHIFVRHIDEDSSFEFTEELFVMKHLSGVEVASLEGFMSLTEFLDPFASEISQDLRDHAVTISDLSNQEVDDVESLSDLVKLVEKMVSLPDSAMSLYELEYGPVENIFSIAADSFVNFASIRDRELLSIYPSYKKQIIMPVVPTNSLYSRKVVLVLPGDVGMLRVDVEHSCSECRKKDSCKREREAFFRDEVTMPEDYVSPDEFFS